METLPDRAMGFFLFVFNFFFFFFIFFFYFFFNFLFFFKFFSYIFSLCPIPFCPIPCPYPLTPNQIRVRDGIANWAPGPVASSYFYYPIPQKGMGSCSSLVSCTLLLFFTSSSCRSKTRLNFGLVFKISQ